jgi:serine phosphatase RsbU (regulator of sigma subunit)
MPVAPRARNRRLLGYALALVVPVALSVALEDVAQRAGSSSGVLLLAVVIAASLGGLRSGLLAAAMVVGCQRWFFLTPHHSLRIDSTDDGIILSLFLASGITIAAIVHLLDLARESERQEANRSRKLHALTGALSILQPIDDLEASCAELGMAATGAAWFEVENGEDDDQVLAREGRSALATDTVVVVEGEISVASRGRRRCLYRFGFDRPVSPETLVMLDAIGSQCSSALERLFYRRAELLEVGEHELVTKAATLLSAAADPQSVLDAVCDLVLPDIVDSCEILRRERWGVAKEAEIPASVPQLRIPLVSRNEVVADFVVGRAEGFDPIRVGLVNKVAELAAQALDRAILFEQQRLTSLTLQRSLLPGSLLPVPGLDVAAHYLAVGEFEVGGDFYDAIRHNDGSMTLIIGDVQGKGLEAATLNALARQTLRAVAMRGRGPAEMLDDLNRALLYTQEEQSAAGDDDDLMRLVTASVVHLAPAGESFLARVSCGGHPAPIIVRADGSVERPESLGTILGLIPDPTLQEVAVELSLADTLVLYTDGVTDVYNGEDFLGDEDLARLIRNRLDLTSAEAVSEHIISTVRGMAMRELRDDIAVVVARVTRRV